MNKCIVTTSWDDCQQFDEKLSSLLLDYGIHSTFYVVKTWKGRPVDTDLIRELDKDFEIGAHTISHPTLTSIDSACAFNEIRNSKEWLEELLNHEIEMFSYPKGKYNSKIVKFVEQAGFKGARVLDFQIVLPKNQFMLGVGTQASNGSPFLRLRASLNSKLSLRSIVDWGVNAKLLFDRVLERGGIWHLWGHSWEIEKNRQWKILEDVLAHVSGIKNADYLTNGQIIELVRAHNAVPTIKKGLS
jgi:peptidoglycan/xylan/chitin deacetylase (PgdA/CDA1 family)